jgi:hypothetical protein
MITEPKFSASRQGHSFGVAGLMAAALLSGVLAASAQTGQYLFTGSITNITLNPGTYDIKAYGAQGGLFYDYISGGGAQGADPLATNTLNNGISSFSDTNWTDFPVRFYRVQEP